MPPFHTQSPPALIDTNVSLSRWPCRRLPYDDTPGLVEHLQRHGITQAWAGSFDALLHRDVAGVNLRVAAACREAGSGVLQPVGCVNPALPDWQDDLRRCAAEHEMRMIRLHPNYHRYSLSDPVFAELLDLALQRQLIVQIAARMEDPRTHHPLLHVPDVDFTPLPALLQARSGLRVVITNGLQVLKGATRAELAALPNVCIDIATQEGVGGLSQLIREFAWERVLFGSHCPFFVLQSAVLKLQESELGAEIQQAIMHGNASRLLQSPGN